MTTFIPPRKELFLALAKEWKEDPSVQISSSIFKIVSHPAYQKIIDMGPPAIPLILQELKRESGHWFYALAMLSGENPVPKEMAGQVRNMRECWLKWGRDKGYIK